MPGQLGGLAPIFLSAGPAFAGTHVTLGARGDSYYEYMLKAWVQSGHAHSPYKSHRPLLQRMYVRAMRSVRDRLVRETRPARNGGRLFIAEADAATGDTTPKMDHLVCYLPGLLALGTLHGLETGAFPLCVDLCTGPLLRRV